MYLENGKLRCDAEGCKSLAKYLSQGTIVRSGDSILHYCERHVGHATDKTYSSQPRKTRLIWTSEQRGT